jgi:CBS domain-containing protein
MSVGRICNRSVHLVAPDETIHQAACRMRDHAVGMLVAVDDTGRPIGVVSDRDLAIRALADGHAVDAPVATVMTMNPRTIAEEAPLETVLSLMRYGGVRRLPVVDRHGKLAGLVALDDVMSLLAEELTMIGGLLARQLPCRNDAPTAEPLH